MFFLFCVQSCSLLAPRERKFDAPSDCFCAKSGRLPAFHNGLNYIRRQESQTDQAPYVADG